MRFSLSPQQGAANPSTNHHIVFVKDILMLRWSVSEPLNSVCLLYVFSLMIYSLEDQAASINPNYWPVRVHEYKV